MTITSSPINVLDAAAASKPIAAYTDGTNDVFAHVLWNTLGAIINPATSDNQVTANAALTAIQAAVTGATPAGTAIIGKVTTDQSAHGTTDLVAADITKVGGSALSLGQKVLASSIPVALASDQTLPLPTGAATAANQATTITSLATVATNTGNIPAKGQATMANSTPVAIASDQTLPLPTGAATAANQSTGNTSIGNVDTNLGAKADSAASTDTGTFSLIALLKRMLSSTTTLIAACQAATPAGENHLGEVGGRKVEVSVEIIRPADAAPYAAGDSVNTSTSAPTVITFSNLARISGGSGYVTKVRVVTDKKSITPRMRLSLWNATPTLVNDNAAFARFYADESKRIGYVDLPAMFTPSDTTSSTLSETQDATIRIPFVAVGSRSIFGTLETLDAFTPATGQKFNITLAADLD